MIFIRIILKTLLMLFIGSPFKVRIQNPVDASKVKCYGPGLDTKGVKAGEPATFTVDTSEVGEAPIEATTTDQAGECISWMNRASYQPSQ